MIKYLACALSICITSCAVISTSQYETAKTLGEGNSQFGLGAGMGRDVSSGIYTDSNVNNFPTPIMEFYGKSGFSERVDGGMKMWISIGGVGVKGHTKFQITPAATKFHLAFAPGISWTGTDITANETDHSVFVSAVSAHIPMLWSAHPSPHAAMYGGFQFIYSHISVKDWNGEKKKYDQFSPGFTFGFQFLLGPVALMPEFSLYHMKDFLSGTALFVIFPNVGIGFNF